MSGKGHIAKEKPQQCDICGKIDELRPYGPNGECVCFECGMKDKPATVRQFRKHVFGEAEIVKAEIIMNHDAINRLIHEIAYPGKCWHCPPDRMSNPYGYTCVFCGVAGIREDKPDYVMDVSDAMAAWTATIKRYMRLLRTQIIHHDDDEESLCARLNEDTANMAGRLEEFQKLMGEK